VASHYLARVTEQQLTPPAPKRSRGRVLWLVLGVVVGVVVILAGAFVVWVLVSPDEADIPAIEKEISQGVQEQGGVAVDVDCPDTVEWQSGQTFHCDVAAEDGTTGKATVTMENDDGDITWSVE